MDDNFDDYFEEGSVPKEKNPEVETAEQREEREIREATIDRRFDRRRMLLLGGVALLVIIFLWWLGSRYMSVYASSSERGVVMELVNRGSVFKTYEGKMMTERAYRDTILYRTDFCFTVRDDSVASTLSRLAGRGRVVTVDYEVYKSHFPWRGESDTIVTAVRLSGD